MLSRRVVFIAIVLIVIAIAIYVSLGIVYVEKSTLKILCAGSLKIPLQKVSSVFSRVYDVDIYVEAHGSVDVVRYVVELKKKADIVAVADYRLIPMYMYPKYSRWYIAFATNEIVIAFTNKSRYYEEVLRDPSKIFEVLQRPDVKYGFSDPNRDPCGYRSVGVIALAALYFNNMSILQKLVIEKIPGSKLEIKDNEVHVYIPATYTPRKNLVVRPKSVDLVALLEAGELDYAFEYRSVAIQRGLQFIELPPEINLGNPSKDQFYRRVVIHILYGTEDEKAIPMKSIVYGITVPVNAENRDLAIKFIEFLLSDKSRKIFEECGHPFLEKPIGYGEIPNELRSYVVISKEKY